MLLVPIYMYTRFMIITLINVHNYTDALKECVGLKLVGPYLILAGRLNKSSWEDCVLESRYFYDTPEVQTVLESTTKSGYHIGYFR